MNVYSTKDPLSEKTRKERNLLILVSVVGLLCSSFNIGPGKMVISGLEFTNFNTTTFTKEQAINLYPKPLTSRFS